jgi:hypothetical protein
MPINSFLSKKGASMNSEDLKKIYEGDYKVKIVPQPTGFEGDYDRVWLDEQTDDWAGFPRADK